MNKILLGVVAILIIGVAIIGFSLIKKENTSINSSNLNNSIAPGINQSVFIKSIEIKYFSDKPGFGYYDMYIINSSGKYIGVSANDYWMTRLGNPKPKFLGDISEEELNSLYTQIENKGFFNWTGDYSSMAKNYAGGSATKISILTSDKENTVNVFGDFGPSGYYEVETLIKAQYPEKTDCSLKNQEDFPDKNLSQSTCPDPYYVQYYDKCTCI